VDFGDIFNILGGGPLAVIIIIVILVLLIAYVARRYQVADANEAIVVAGSRGNRVRNEKGELVGGGDDKGIKVVVGGGTIVLPLIQRAKRLKLSTRQVSIHLSDAVTEQGIVVEVQGVATFKVGRDVESIRNAAERFLTTADQQLDDIVKNVLEGTLRSIVGTLTIEKLISDRLGLKEQVTTAVEGDLRHSGLIIDSFTIQSINDRDGYIKYLGEQKLAVVEKDAAIAKANAAQLSAVAQADADRITIEARQTVALRKAEADTLTEAAAARAAQAAPLAQADAQREVVERQTELANLEAARKEKELLATVVRPAEAEAEAVARRADGERLAQIAAAQARAEGVRLAGQAEADAILARGEAEAEALRLRAEAYKQFNDAAVLQTVLAELPKIVAAAAEPMRGIGSMTVLSSEGASDVVRTATRTAAEGSALIKGMTGIDIPELVGNAMGAKRPTPREIPPRDDGGEQTGDQEGSTPKASGASTLAGMSSSAVSQARDLARRSQADAAEAAATVTAAVAGPASTLADDLLPTREAMAASVARIPSPARSLLKTALTRNGPLRQLKLADFRGRIQGARAAQAVDLLLAQQPQLGELSGADLLALLSDEDQRQSGQA